MSSSTHFDDPVLLEEALARLNKAAWHTAPASQETGIYASQLNGVIQENAGWIFAVSNHRLAAGVAALK